MILPSNLLPILRVAALLLFTVSGRLHAENPAAPVETDQRLHADGKGWKFNKAVITDKTRPRVLLMGDSILGG